MSRLSKLVAALTLCGAVTSSMSVPFAHAACMAGAKDPGHGCHSMDVQQSCSTRHLQAADGFCCQIVPALPAKAATHAVMGSTVSTTNVNLAPPSTASHSSRAAVENFRTLPSHCRWQALLCVFLI